MSDSVLAAVAYAVSLPRPPSSTLRFLVYTIISTLRRAWLPIVSLSVSLPSPTQFFRTAA